MKTGRYKKVKYVLYTLDVCGNKKDGFEVNDLFYAVHLKITANEKVYNINTQQEFKSFAVENKNIILILKRLRYLKRNIHHSSLDIHGEQDSILFIDNAKTGEPLFQLQCKTPEIF